MAVKKGQCHRKVDNWEGSTFSFAVISSVRSENIGRRDENSPYEHVSPVAEMKCSVLIGRQFACG